MLKFFEDAVQLLRETKKPTREEVINMTIAVLVIILIFWVFFWVVDFIFINLYNFFYELMQSIVW